MRRKIVSSNSNSSLTSLSSTTSTTFQEHRRPITTLGILVGIAAIIYKELLASPPFVPIHPGDAILITGSSTGIGKHAALSLVKEGFTVFACVRKEQDGQALIESAEKFQLDTSYLKPIIMDVTNSEQIEAAVQTVSSVVGERGLRGLINNAGVCLETATGPTTTSKSTSVEYMDLEIYRKTFDVNYFGLVEVTKAFLPLLRKGKGRILMNTSVAGIVVAPFMSAYGSSKHAVEGFSDSLRRELLPLGVKVSILEPGYITTPILLAATNIPTEGGEGEDDAAAAASFGSMEPYRDAEQNFWSVFWKDTIGAPSPKVTSEAIIDAMRSKSPQTRYCVGKSALIVKFLSYLPSHWLDFMMKLTPKGTFTKQEKQLLLEAAQTEFDL